MNTLINPVIPGDDQQEAQAILSAVEEQMGFVPDGIRLYAISPPLLKTFVGTVGYFRAHPTLSQELLAMIRYLVSSEAQCSFCIDLNAGFLLNMGKTREQLDAAMSNTADAPLSDSEKVVLQLALASIDHPQDVTQADIQRARDAGFSDREIFDVVAIAANNKAFTHVLKTFKVEQQGAIA